MPLLEILTSSGFASLLGMRHALEPDHIAAVTTLVSREQSSYRAAWLGVCWGIGHTLTLFVVGLGLVLVRKEAKGYGTSRQIEGRFETGRRVTVIEDVVTTGGDSLRTIKVLRGAQLEPIHLVVVLDRGEGGTENISGAGIPYSPLFRIEDLTLD